MSKIGYARASSITQDTCIQIAALQAAGCTVIREEKVSGTSISGRTELQTVLDFLRPGDELVVTRIDRLARSIGDLQIIIGAIKNKSASLTCTEQPIDTGTAAGKCFLDMLGVFAEFETNLRKERQREGIDKKKAEGGYKGKGRKQTIDVDEINRLVAEGLGATAIAKQLGIGRASVYRLLNEAGNTANVVGTPDPEQSPSASLKQRVVDYVRRVGPTTPAAVAGAVKTSTTTSASIMHGLVSEKVLIRQKNGRFASC